MEFLSKTTHLDFMGKRRLTMAISAFFIVASLLLLATRGLNFGIEFKGGVVIEAGFPEAPDLGAIRAGLGTDGFADATVQNFGSSRDVVIQLEADETREGSEVRDRVLTVLRGSIPPWICGASSSSGLRSARSSPRRAVWRLCSRC